MSVEQALFEHVTGTAAVSALLVKRMYASLAPSDAKYPHAVYTLVSEEHIGNLRSLSGLAKTTFQISSWGKTAEDARALSEQILISMNAFFQITLGGTLVFSARPVAARVDYEDAVSAYRAERDFDVWHQETVT